jgi:hypothetical protein
MVTDQSDDGRDDASLQVVLALAESRDVDPLDLDVRLGDHVDTTALGQMVDHAREHERSLTIQFAVGEQTVTIETDDAGRVSRLTTTDA